MRILINVPSLRHLGGVANHYLGLRPYWRERVRYNVVGRRGKRGGSGRWWLPWDVAKFVLRLLLFRPDIVVVNPSLGMNALRRDFLFLNIACRMGFKVAVFIHGFDWDVAAGIDRDWVVRHLNRAQVVLVLAEAFRKELRSWGVTSRLVLTTTKVDDRMLGNFDPTKRTGKFENILYLARVERAKGIYITIDTYALLKARYPQLRLTIVGDGSELAAVRRYVADKGLADVAITGALHGDKLAEALKAADASSSSSYGEGMPTAVLEAMAFGLPVFTRNVGGLPDFFENGRMGYITDSLSAIDFAEAMVPYIEDAELTRRTAAYNHAYAREHFMASHVASALEKVLSDCIEH